MVRKPPPKADKLKKQTTKQTKRSQNCLGSSQFSVEFYSVLDGEVRISYEVSVSYQWIFNRAVCLLAGLVTVWLML